MIRNTAYRILCICLIFVLTLSLSVGHVDAASTPAKGKKPSLSSKTNTSITVKWKASKNAKKYQLAYKIKGGSWKNYKKTTAKSLTVSSLKASKPITLELEALMAVSMENGRSHPKASRHMQL